MLPLCLFTAFRLNCEARRWITGLKAQPLWGRRGGSASGALAAPALLLCLGTGKVFGRMLAVAHDRYQNQNQNQNQKPEA